jgi:hypothetical protein
VAQRTFSTGAISREKLTGGGASAASAVPRQPLTTIAAAPRRTRMVTRPLARRRPAM